MTHGRVITEHDIHRGAWYLDCGRIPTCIAVEAGQADLFLSGYLGIDFSFENGAYRIKKILEGAPWDSEARSPLREPGVSIKEGDAGVTMLEAEIKLDRPAPVQLQFNYSTSDEDATERLDYIPASGVLVIPPGATSGIIRVGIVGDLLRENNERFNLNFSNAINVIIPANDHSRIMIIDDDKGKANKTIANNEQSPVREEIFKIPSVARRNQVWMIPQISNYENEVLIVNVQGQVVSRFVNYHNQTALGNVSTGLYFYRIRIMESPGQNKYYTGRLLITE